MPEPLPLPRADGPVRFALLLQTYGQGPDARWEEWARVVRLAEQAGFAGVHAVDHLYMQTERIYGPRVVEGQPDILECWTTLAALAAGTERMWVGPLVSPVALRHPVLIAKQAATVDRVSGGRLLLALGAGWNRPEFESFGFPFDESFSVRAEKLKEGVEVIRRLFTEDGWVDFPGKHYRLEKAPFWPKPVRKPPLWFGGGGSVIRELVAREGDGWCPAAQHYKGFTPEVYADKLADIRERTRAAGRDPKAITPAITFLTAIAKSRGEALEGCALMRKRRDWSDLSLDDMEKRGVIVLGTPEECTAGVSRYVEAGARYIILHIMPYDLKAAERAIEMYARHVLPRFA